MAASTRAPAEVWSLILYSTFEFYLGCDYMPNIYEDQPRVRDYWATERQRCLLRLICKSWKECVDKKQHRLLEIWDFLYHKMGDGTMLKAECVLFNLPHHCGRWNCRGCENMDTQLWLKGFGDPFVRPFRSQGRQINLRFAEKMQWTHFHIRKFIKVFLDFHSRYPKDLRAQAIRSSKYINIEDVISSSPKVYSSIISLDIAAPTSHLGISNLSTAFPQLVHLGLFTSDPISEILPSNSLDSTIRFPYLESFITTFDSRDLIALGFSSWRIPRLKYLQLPGPPHSLDTLINLLGPHSKCLRSLYFSFCGMVQFSMDEQLWDLLPKLESIDWVLPSETIIYLPESHPLSMFLLNPRTLHALHYSALVEGVDALLEKRHLKLKFWFPWDTFCIRDGNFSPNRIYRPDWHIDINKWAKMGIEIVDINDVPWSKRREGTQAQPQDPLSEIRFMLR